MLHLTTGNLGWAPASKIRKELSFTDGRIYVRGKIHARGEKKRADYILCCKPNLPVAVIEAKDHKHTAAAGSQFPKPSSIDNVDASPD